MLMALYLHLGPFSKHVISEIDRRIAELDEMRERLAKYSLSLHPEKTRLIEFGRHAAANRKRRLGKPETFSFLGFIFISGKSRRASSRSNGSLDPTACGRNCKPSNRSCAGECISRSPDRGNG
jgi:hypothetical protein